MTADDGLNASEAGVRIVTPSVLADVPRPLLSRRAATELPELSDSDHVKKRRLEASEGITNLETSKYCSAVSDALDLYSQAWGHFLANRYWHGEEKACESAEIDLCERYETACDALVRLLQWTNHEECEYALDDNSKYVVASIEKTTRVLDEEAVIFDALQRLRDASTWGGAREAFCAVLAVLASRPEKNWLDGFMLDGCDLESLIKDRLRWKRDKDACLRNVVSDLVSKNCRGHFSRALVDPRSQMRVAFAKTNSGLRPASLISTYELPFADALEHMDGFGPFGLRLYKWFSKASREFAFQRICTGAAREDGQEREHASSLVVEPAIKELLCSRKPVLLLDAFAALAPRKMAKAYDLSRIIRFELAELLRRAKARGIAVVFTVGGNESHLLAEKVYLQRPFTDSGLRCGYLRWRESSRDSWEREDLKWQDRYFLGLQLP